MTAPSDIGKPNIVAREHYYGLDGRVALITGSTRNIGRQTAVTLGQLGAKIGVWGSANPQRLEETLAMLTDLGIHGHGVLHDLAEPAGVEAGLREIVDALGPIDVLVNNSAVRPRKTLADISVADWEAVQNVNVRAPFLLAQAVLPGMMDRSFGRIVNVSGLDAFWGEANRTHVVASKAAIVGLTVALASESAGSGVTVNAVVPGIIDTERHELGWWPDVDSFYAAALRGIPMRRLGTREEVASVIAFLASNGSSYMTGQTLFVTGGAFPMANGLTKSPREHESDPISRS